jgi:hypothetical protein
LLAKQTIKKISQPNHEYDQPAMNNHQDHEYIRKTKHMIDQPAMPCHDYDHIAMPSRQTMISLSDQQYKYNPATRG